MYTNIWLGKYPHIHIHVHVLQFYMYPSFKHLRVPSTYIEIMVTNIDINSNNNSLYSKYHMILKVERSEKL